MSRFLPSLAVLPLLGACGTGTTGPDGGGSVSPSPSDDGTLFADATVLEGGRSG